MATITIEQIEKATPEELERIYKEINEQADKLKDERSRVEERLKMRAEQLAVLEKELSAEGVDLSNLDNEIERISQELREEAKKCNLTNEEVKKKLLEIQTILREEEQK